MNPNFNYAIVAERMQTLQAEECAQDAFAQAMKTCPRD